MQKELNNIIFATDEELAALPDAVRLARAQTLFGYLEAKAPKAAIHYLSISATLEVRLIAKIAFLSYTWLYHRPKPRYYELTLSRTYGGAQRTTAFGGQAPDSYFAFGVRVGEIVALTHRVLMESKPNTGKHE